MARFYVEIKGCKPQSKPIHRLGHRGQSATVASWHGAVHTEAYIRGDGVDCVRVTLEPWKGSDTVPLVLYDGPMNGRGEYSTDLG